jgi:hypothetical protein
MFLVGSLVKFVWWSNYRAPSVFKDAAGRTTWHEVHPGDTGVILGVMDDDETYIVLFSNVDAVLKIHKTMLSLVV